MKILASSAIRFGICSLVASMVTLTGASAQLRFIDRDVAGDAYRQGTEFELRREMLEQQLQMQEEQLRAMRLANEANRRALEAQSRPAR